MINPGTIVRPNEVALKEFSFLKSYGIGKVERVNQAETSDSFIHWVSFPGIEGEFGLFEDELEVVTQSDLELVD